MLAILVIGCLAMLNSLNMKVSIILRYIFTASKIVALVIIILSGISQMIQGNVSYFTWEDSEVNPTKLVLSLYPSLFAYGGWNSLNMIVECLERPAKSLPIALGT